jgi:hypothetical protein
VQLLTAAVEDMRKRPFEFISQFERLLPVAEAAGVVDAITRQPVATIRGCRRAYFNNGTGVVKPKRPNVKVQDFHALFSIQRLTPHRVFAQRDEHTNTPMLLDGPALEHSGGPRPCLVAVEALIQATVGDEKVPVVIGTARLLKCAVGSDGVGVREFRPVATADYERLAAIPSVLGIEPDWPRFKVAVPLHNVLCTLIASQDKKVFLPCLKSTGR